jgi:hypothetical protein
LGLPVSKTLKTHKKHNQGDSHGRY